MNLDYFIEEMAILLMMMTLRRTVKPREGGDVNHVMVTGLTEASWWVGICSPWGKQVLEAELNVDCYPQNHRYQLSGNALLHVFKKLISKLPVVFIFSCRMSLPKYLIIFRNFETILTFFNIFQWHNWHLCRI